MRKLGFWLFLSLIGANLLAYRVSADEKPITLEQNIVTNCASIKVRLRQVRANDTLTRVNYGQTYESMIKNVFTPANTRLVANRYNASGLVELASKFETNLSQFRIDYQNYKNQMEDLINADCLNHPAEFYQKLTEIRGLRTSLQRHLAKLDEQIVNYQTEIARTVDARK